MATIHCTNITQLQTAVSTTAVGGDIITMPAGGTITGNLTIPKRTLSSYITIRTDAADVNLPAAGVRVNPSYLGFLATLASANTVPIIDCAKGANHFKFIGIHFAPKPDGFGNQINMGGDHGSGATLADVCTDMEFDRCLFRGHPVAGQLRAIHVGVTRFRFTNNYCDRFGSQGQQGNILAIINGEGDHVIENNYFSGSTQCILYGGGSIRARVVTSVVSATTSSATLAATTDLRVGQRIAFLADAGTRRRWPKCLSVNHTTKAITFETLDVVPDIPGEARWGVVEKNIVIARNKFSHDPSVVVDGVLPPTTGVSTADIAGSFTAVTVSWQVQAYGSGYTGQEARGTASAATSPLAISAGRGRRITWSAVANATNYYIYRTVGSVITRFSVGAVTTFDDVGTGGTVVGSVPSATVFVGWIGVELKQGIDVHIHSNIFEWMYKGSFGGEAILIKAGNQEGTASFISTENVLVENNVMRHTWGFGTVSGSETGSVAFTMDLQPRPVENLTFRNNLHYDSLSSNLGAGQSALSRYFITVVNGAKNVQFIHNTSTHEGSGCFYVEQNVRGSLDGLLIRDNMLRGNTYMVASNNGFGAAGLANATAPGTYTFSFNAVANPSNTSSKITGSSNQYADYASWVTEFVDGTGADIDDYALDVGSTFENDASDGTDIGCDIAALNTALTGVDSGAAAGAAPPVVLTASLANGTQGVAYSQTLAASGGTAPYTWAVVSGSLPAGLSLAPSTGVISGTPTTAGGSTFTVRATDAAAQTGSKSLTITIAAPAAIPVITATSLPSVVEGNPYSTTLVATSGTPPYAGWSVVSGALPTGLSLAVDTGVISGTPSVAGLYSFDVVVQDSTLAVSLAQNFSITIASASPSMPIPGRPARWNFMEGILFVRDVAPTVTDLADTGDVWIKRGTGLVPEGYIAQRSGSSLTWNKWPSNEARVREIAREEQGPLTAKTLYIPTWTAAGGSPAVGNGTLDGVFSQVGKKVTARIRFIIGSTTNLGTGDWTFSLPVAIDVDSSGSAKAIDVGTARYSGGIEFPTTSTLKVFVPGANTFWGAATPIATPAAGDSYVITVTYWVP